MATNRKSVSRRRPRVALKQRSVIGRRESDKGETLTLDSFMTETNGGGAPENVPGFDFFRAVTAGFETRRIAGPTFLAARPDGGFFSQSGDTAAAPMRSPAAKPENVIGADNRVIVTNTSMTPWRCICHLEVEYERGPVGFGTGFMISEHAVVTAGHVLVDRSRDWKIPRRARRVRVVPGRNGTLAPYGYFVSEHFAVADGWDAAGANQETADLHDFGAIFIPDDLKVREKDFGKRIGYFGLKVLPGDDNSLLLVNNGGYPHETDKPYGTLWYNAGRVSKMDKNFIEYMVDTEGGQSGSPIYFYDEKKNERYVVAIHTTGDFINRGLRITRDVFDTIRGWAKR